jgi:hypothetical protein
MVTKYKQRQIGATNVVIREMIIELFRLIFKDEKKNNRNSL